MMSRRAKATFYALMGPPMKLNGFVYRTLRAPRSGTIKVHLGPGKGKYFDGWVNVDANLFTAKIDLWADLRNRLPFRDATVDVFYSHHVIEHLPDASLPFHFSELFRCLKPGGFIRVAGPHGENAMRKFIEGDAEWFSNFPDKRESVGGRLANFILCRGEHLTILTPSYLKEIADAAGFQNVRTCQPTTQTYHPESIGEALLKTEKESRPDFPSTLVIEADKPLRVRGANGMT
jgi:predicted SAM-dependent methyltransferase